MRKNKISSIASVFVLIFVILILYLLFVAVREKTNFPAYSLSDKELSERAQVELSIVRKELDFAIKNSILNAIYKTATNCCSEVEYTVIGENIYLEDYNQINNKIIQSATQDFKEFLLKYPTQRGIFSVYVPALEGIELSINKNRIEGGLYDQGFDLIAHFSEPINITYNKLTVSSSKELKTTIKSKFYYVLRNIRSFIINKDYNNLKRTLSSADPIQHVSIGCQIHNFDNIASTIREEFSKQLNTKIDQAHCTNFFILNGTSAPNPDPQEGFRDIVVNDECTDPDDHPICKNLRKDYNSESWNQTIINKFAQATIQRRCLQYVYYLSIEVITICQLPLEKQYTDLGVEPLTFRFKTILPIDVFCKADLSCP